MSEDQLRAVAKEMLASYGPIARPTPDPNEDDWGRFHRAADNLASVLAGTALSQTPEAESAANPPFDLGRALATIERLKSAHHPDSRAVADLDNLAFCLKLAAGGEVDSPPPTAPGEASEEVSESVDSSRGDNGPYWVRAEPVPTAQRFEFTIVGPDGVAEAGSFIGDHESRDLAEEEAESLNDAYAEGYGAAQNEAKVAATPQNGEGE